MKDQRIRFNVVYVVIMLLACLLVHYDTVLGSVSFSIIPTPIGVTISDAPAETEVSTLVNLNQNYVVNLQEIFSGDPNVSNELAADTLNRSYSYLAFYKSSNSDSFPATKHSTGNYNQNESTTSNVSVSYSRSYTGDCSATVRFAKSGYWRIVFIVAIKQPKRDANNNVVYDNAGNTIYEIILVADCEMDFIAAKINTPTCKEKSYGMNEFKSTEDGNVIWDCDKHEYSVTYTPSDITDVKLYKKSVQTSTAVSTALRFNPRSNAPQSQAYWQSGIVNDNGGVDITNQNNTNNQDSFFLAVDQSGVGKVDNDNSLGIGNHNITAKKENGKNPIKSETKNIFQTKLKSVVWRTYETAQKDSNFRYAKLTDKKVFPEKKDPNEESYNYVVIDISIEESIPKDLTGTLFFKVLDPMNQCKTSNGERIGSGINDNDKCKMNYDKFTVNITEGDSTKKSIALKINPAQPGANFIIAGHPRNETTEKITIKTTNTTDNDFKTPIITDGNGSEQIIQTELLTVWRTLWCELDQMEEPGYNIQDAYIFDSNNDSIPDSTINRELYFADADKKTKWDTIAPKNEAEQFATFDLHAQPPLPTTTVLTEQLEKACVLVEVYKNNELEELPFVPVLALIDTESKKLDDKFAWIENPREYAKGNKQKDGKNIPYRSIPESSSDYWTIHVISAYEYDYDDHDNHEAFGSKGPTNNISITDGRHCKQTHGYNDHTAYIFYETIRDNTVTHCKCKNVCPLKYTDDVEFKEYASTGLFFDRTVAHEVLHSFLGVHKGGTESINPQSISDQTIMNYHLRYNDFDCTLNKNQIQHIQKLQYPKGAKD